MRGPLPEINLQIESVEIRATNRRLRFNWTHEAQQDYDATTAAGMAMDLVAELFSDSEPIDYDWRVEGF